MRKLGEIGAAFIRAKLRQSSIGIALRAPHIVRHAGQWKDGRGIVHAVNALSIGFESDIDAGRETACEATFWNPEEPWLYPDVGPSESEVDCMACVAGG